MNLEYMRKENIANKLIGYMRKNIKKIILHDQDGLNGVLHSKWIKLPEAYNYMISFDLYLPKLKKPKIIHFAGIKPQMVRILNPQHGYMKKYYEYLKMANIEKEDLSKEDIAKYFKRVYNAFFEKGFFFK